MNSALISTFKGPKLLISRSVSTNYSFDSETETVSVDASGGAVQITLPLISSNIGRAVGIRKIDSSANVVTVITAGSDLYQGVSSVALSNQWSTLCIDNDGIQWHSSSTALSVFDPSTLGIFNVKSYGAMGDGTTNDYAAIQTAITAAEVAGGTVLFPAGTYRTNSELTASSTRKLTIKGNGPTGTVIRAGAAITSVLNITGTVNLEDFTLDGNLLAQYAGRASGGGCSECVFTRIVFTHAKKDGWYFPITGIYDNNSFYDCVFEFNGTIFRNAARSSVGGAAIETVTSGSVATNGLTITGTGTAFTSMGIRRGDFISVGVFPLTEYLMINSVTDDTHIVLEDTSSAVNIRSSQPFAVSVGDGYHESYGAADNNINKLIGGRARANAGCGLLFGGLYGPVVTGIQIDVHYNGYAICVGNGMTNPCYGAQFTGVYIEGCAAGGWYLGYAPGITISGTVDTGLGSPRYDGQVTTGTPPRWRASDSSRAFGTWIGSSRFSYSGASDIDPIGGGISNMPVSTTVAQRFTVVGNLRLNAIICNAVAGTTITPSSAFPYMSLTGAVTMTATPSINTTGYNYGDILFMSIASGASELTFQDETLLAGSKIHLGKFQKLALSTDNTALWWFSPAGYWSLIATDGVLSNVVGSGTHAVGQIVWNPTPVAGGTVGWICVTAGTPGVFKEFGLISA